MRQVINRLIFFAPKKLFEYQRRIGKRVLEKERCVNKIICCDRGLIERKKGEIRNSEKVKLVVVTGGFN